MPIPIEAAIATEDSPSRETRTPGRSTWDPRTLAAFRQTVLEYYRAHGRDLPWRRTRDAYGILVSEVMLQQTQVSRVVEKYEEWLAAFPDLESLAAAPLARVLAVWQGLGYNRRALALKRLAEMLVALPGPPGGAQLPREQAGLRALPGIGPATAAAVAAFAYDEAHPFIETNIRAVYLHHFFPDETGVHDREILPLVEATLDRADPRTWYYALMDYGVMLKASHPNPSRRSRHHVRQSRFEGSPRQLRARVLRLLLERPGSTMAEIAAELEHAGSPVGERFEGVLTGLMKEGLIERTAAGYRIGP